MYPYTNAIENEEDIKKICSFSIKMLYSDFYILLLNCHLTILFSIILTV